EVIMVSGADQHGTPITIKAEQEGKTPAEVAGFFHQEFLKSWEKLGISFDIFTSTGTPNHAAVAQEIFLTLLRRGYIYTDIVSQAYCAHCERFLPDRYIEGICPNCRAPSARGDQCDACGKPLNPVELIEAKCRLCGGPPVYRNSEHFFLKLSAFSDRLYEWVTRQRHWRPNVYSMTMRYLEEGLRDRAITRDIEWGIRVPVKGYESKRLYVWFEAVIGYLSGSKEWAQRQGDPEKWRPFWQGDARSYYFIGKDNIPFHTLIWPAMLMGYDESLVLPFDVPANEFLTIEGRKISTSRNWALWLPDYLSRYDPDPLRYLLSINMPDSGDTDFSWREFIRRNNDELVATYGNLVNRVLTFVYRNFDRAVPEPGTFDSQDAALVEMTEKTLAEMDGMLSGCRFREAIRAALSLAQETNRYLDRKSPWKTIKEDRPAAATALYAALCAISGLRTAFYPFLPFSSQKQHEYLGFGGSVQAGGWKLRRPAPGQRLLEPKPLFTKFEESMAEEETGRLGQPFHLE
ncbi:MAG: methionine--tRNA ligase, partial [Chloroflexi bacterium]|nr:methionine--tRNA ligase [Chloroflexota bacterium]